MQNNLFVFSRNLSRELPEKHSSLQHIYMISLPCNTLWQMWFISKLRTLWSFWKFYGDFRALGWSFFRVNRVCELGRPPCWENFQNNPIIFWMLPLLKRNSCLQNTLLATLTLRIGSAPIHCMLQIWFISVLLKRNISFQNIPLHASITQYYFAQNSLSFCNFRIRQNNFLVENFYRFESDKTIS